MVRPVYPIPLPDGGMVGADGRRLTSEEQRHHMVWLKRQRVEVEICNRRSMLVICFVLISTVIFGWLTC